MNIFRRIKDYIEAYFIYRKLLNDLNKMTDEELKVLEVSGWKQYTYMHPQGDMVERFPVNQNDGYFWRGDDLLGNITPQCKLLDAVQVIFYQDLENGVRVTQPIEVVATEKELKRFQSAKKRKIVTNKNPY